jgi:hypothetical protein
MADSFEKQSYEQWLGTKGYVIPKDRSQPGGTRSIQRGDRNSPCPARPSRPLCAASHHHTEKRIPIGEA